MGMSASQGRLLFMTARLSNNEFEQQSVAYSKQRLADSSQKANDEYLEALKATKYQVLTGYNGTDPNYENVTYNQLTGYFGQNSFSYGDGSVTNQQAGVAANKQYIVTDNKGQILVTKAIADAFTKSLGDYNKFLEYFGLTQAPKIDPTQQEVHDAWDKYFVSVGKSINDGENSIHVAGFAYNRKDKSDSTGADVEFASYSTKQMKSQAIGADGNITNELLYLNLGTVGENAFDNKYYVNSYQLISVPDPNNEGSFLPAYQPESIKGTDEYVIFEDQGFTYKDGKVFNESGEILYLSPLDNTFTTDSKQEVDPYATYVITGSENTIFYEGTTKEQRELYDYAMAVSKQHASDINDKLSYDANKIAYYQNIYNQMITHGFTTYEKMNDSGYIQSNQVSERAAFQDENWFVNQLKQGKLNISYYSAVEKKFIGTSLDDDESICEKEDKSKIAIAEQEYNSKMDRLEAQDKQFDLTLNRLEAEHSALQTEYEVVAKIISKNVEKTFNVFNA